MSQDRGNVAKNGALANLDLDALTPPQQKNALQERLAHLMQMENQLRNRLRHHAWHSMPVLTVPAFPGLRIGKTVCGDGMYKEELVTLDQNEFDTKHNKLLNEYTNSTWLKENKEAQAIVRDMIAYIEEEKAASMPAAPMLAAPMPAAPMPPAPMPEPEAGPAPAPESAAAGPSAQGSLAADDEEDEADFRKAIRVAQQQERERREQEWQDEDECFEREQARHLASEMPK